jgi:hypothetical protein
MGQRIEDLSLEALMELFQAITERPGAPRRRLSPPPPARILEKVLVPPPSIAYPAASDGTDPRPVPMDEATEGEGGIWLWFEH